MQSLRQRLRELVLYLPHEGSWRGCFDLLDMDVHDRSMRLLKENLSASQRKQLESRGYFEVVGHLPIGDVLLAQKVALEAFELEALSIANRVVATQGRLPLANEVRP
jgi:hypothetical protein